MAGQSVPPFDVTAARALYSVLIEPAKATGLLDGVHSLTWVPDGALQQLPLHLLIDSNSDWLVRKFATVVSPSVSALAASRAGNRGVSNGAMTFLGIGNASLSGFAGNIGSGSRGQTRQLRRELAKLNQLEDTAEELRQISSIYGSAQSQLILGKDATLRSFLEAKPENFRTISFATHALMAGELDGLTEPAIVLTPSDGESPTDGLLTASEIAVLEFDADLVILSACNTAAPDGGPYAEGLSGLTRAFLHAGARSLLVSHWAVESRATVHLMTGFARHSLLSGVGRGAYALRDAILEMIDNRDAGFNHPAYWAPFVLVGG
jgi:CHAT domain-containing protein